MPDKDLAVSLTQQLLPQVQQLIDAARTRAAAAINAELTLLYWQIGKLLRDHVLEDERAAYGKQVIQGLADDLTVKYGKGWSKQQLLHCLKMAQVFPDEQIVYTAYTIELVPLPEADIHRRPVKTRVLRGNVSNRRLVHSATERTHPDRPLDREWLLVF